jgi:ribonuclease Z
LPSVLLFFDNERYLFNMGEGWQKFSLQHRIKAAKLDGIFITRSTTEAAGGLPGSLLTLADKVLGPQADGSEGKAVSVYGPRGMEAYTNCLRTYINIRDINLTVQEIGPNKSKQEEGAPLLEKHVLIKNRVVEISSVLIDDKAATTTAVTVGGEAERETKRARLGGDSQANVEEGEGGSSDNIQVSMYLIELCDIPGKFLPKKAIDLGVQKGPDFGKLCRGECVVNVDGRTVAPEEVMKASTPGPIAVILDLPSVSYVQSLRETTGALQYFADQSRKQPGKRIVVYHLSPLEVVISEEFKTFLSQWPESTEHIVVNSKDSGKQTIYSSAARLQAKLFELRPQFFPLHKHYVASVATTTADPTSNADAGGKQRVIEGLNMIKYHLRPFAKFGLDDSELVENNQAKEEEEEEEGEEKEKAAAQTSKITQSGVGDEVAKPSCVSEAGRQELEVTFLGTGAAIPSKYRNLAGIYLHMFERGGIQLDCGEGACGQLIRRYGREKFKEILANLKIVWISHIHADHHSGLPSLLRMRSQVSKEKLVVIGPRQLKRVLTVYSKIQYVPIEFIDCANTAAQNNGGSPQESLLQGRLSALGMKSLQSVQVLHSCYHSYGVSLQSNQGWKLSYSGDTRPCEAFIQQALGSTILVHEGTFDNSLLKEAEAKKHSLTGEAIESGRRAKAYRTILTHFSQRYPKIPVIDETFTSSTCIAFDLMTFNLCDIEDLPKIVEDVEFKFDNLKGDAA